MAESSSNNSQLLKRAAIVAAGVAVAGVTYYHFVHKKRTLPVNDLLKLKEEGNVHFTQKRFKEAIEAFTKVIKSGDVKRDAELIAIAYQNRAASLQALGILEDRCVSDCDEAIKLKKLYGRAYCRRAHLLKVKKPMQAFSDFLIASHIDERFAEQLAAIMGTVMEGLERENKAKMEKWKAEKKVPRQNITHDQIYTWLHRTVENDSIRKAYFATLKKKNIDDKLEHALQMIGAKGFASALELIEGEENSAECALLAARLAYYQGAMEDVDDHLDSFNMLVEYGKVDDSAKISLAIFKIQSAQDAEKIQEKLDKAIETHGTEADFFSAAAYRLFFIDAYQQAQKIINDDRFKPHTLALALRHFINAHMVVLAGENPANAFTHIAHLERLLDDIGDKHEHTAAVKLTLAKVYQTFGSVDEAEAKFRELRSVDDSWSIYATALANFYTQKGDTAAASDTVEQALLIEPTNPEAILLKSSLRLCNQGVKLTTRQDYEEMLKEVQPVLDRCISRADFAFANEVLRHVSLVEAKLAATVALGL